MQRGQSAITELHYETNTNWGAVLNNIFTSNDKMLKKGDESEQNAH